MITANYCCLDASAFSLGFAAAHSSTLILEKTENALSDYVNGVIPGTAGEPSTEEGRTFAGFLRMRGCVSKEGIVDAPSLAPAAAEYALRFNILLDAMTVSCEQGSSGCRILAYTNSGLQHIVCQKIVCRPSENGTVKYLNCVVSGTDRKTLSPVEAAGGVIRRSVEEGEFIISMPFGRHCTLDDARSRFAGSMREFFGSSVKIDAFASDFETGGAQRDIIEDFEAGVTFDLL